MADYSVDIKLAVAGARQLKAARRETTALSKEINTLNRLANKQSKTLPNSFNTLNKVLGQAKGNLNRVALGTTRYLRAINDVIDKEERLNRAYRKQKTDFKVIQRLRMKGLDINKQNIQAVRDELAAEIKLARAKKRTAKAENEIAIASKRRNRIIQSAGIGGGFPLLFGGGIQGAIAGGLGGGIGEALSPGGGFAGSIVATAVMRMMTDFTNGITEVGKAMNESSKEFERVQKIVGVEGANKISAFTTQTQTLTKTFGDFILDVQSGVAGLINMSGVLNGLIASMQRGIAMRQVKNSEEFKRRTKNLGVKSAGGRSGGKTRQRNTILNEMTDVQIDKNLQSDADAQANTSFELIQAATKGLERQGFLHDANTEKMRQALEIRFQHQDIIEKLVKAGAVVSDQESDYILKLLEEKQIREENLDLQKEITNIIANDMGNGIKDLITGAKSFNDVMKNALNNMANAFLNLGIFGSFGGGFERGKGLLGRIFRAEGGPVKGGKSYVVGERGTEMFTPGVSGMITPNHALGGSTNVVVNVDASGSAVEGDEDRGRELGRLISVAVQSEIVQQKRPGGILA